MQSDGAPQFRISAYLSPVYNTGATYEWRVELGLLMKEVEWLAVTVNSFTFFEKN